MGKRDHWLQPTVRLSCAIAFIFLVKYEYSVVNLCAAEDSYEHAHNLLRLAHSACNEDNYIFSRVIDCDTFRRAVDPGIRGASKAACWWQNHAIFSGTTAQLLLVVLLFWVVKLLYNYFIENKRMEYRERGRSKAAQKLLTNYYPEYRERGRSPRPRLTYEQRRLH